MRSILFSRIAPAAAAALICAAASAAGINAGERRADPDQPFVASPVASFTVPWAVAFLPDGRMLVTEKRGRLYLVTQRGEKREVAGVPKVVYQGQNGLLDVAPSPGFARDRTIYLSYVEPAKGGGGQLALARARLQEGGGDRLDGLAVIWRANGAASGGQPGGIIAFAPDGRHLFLTSGDRMAPDTAQDPDSAQGKVLRLLPDGGTPPDNPWVRAGGVRAQTWTLGHRNPYGLAFAPDGKLWLNEMGPRGGDELDLLRPGLNYGWPLVSKGINYNGTPIPDHDTRPDFAAPVVYWTPVIAPAGMAFYTGDLFPDWKGSAFIGGLRGETLVRIAFDGKGGADQAQRWDMGHRIRDVAVAADGALWVLEDGNDGRLLRLTPGG
ncbi:PQQ-dependent sugar dehydrogenase [Pigmentiphaga soli]|uniref:PQQ-dependent sugar dehydrogenase n=1 Tax=Pigmentiphaga soli TaxID=1007095 RepID=A0ABP8GZJ2_9BURK